MRTALSLENIQALSYRLEHPPFSARAEYANPCGRVRVATSVCCALASSALLIYTQQYWNGQPLFNPSDESRFYANAVAYMGYVGAVSLLAPLNPSTNCGKVLRVASRLLGTALTGLAATGKAGENHFGVFGIIGPLIAAAPEIARKFCWEVCLPAPTLRDDGYVGEEL